MTTTVSTDEAAEFFEVTPKTVREWLRTGEIPCESGGWSGPGNGAQIDLVRASLWRRVGDKQDRKPPPGPCGGNIPRWLVQSYHVWLRDELAAYWTDWLETKGYQHLGVSQLEAEAIAGEAFGAFLLLSDAFLRKAFEKRLEQLAGYDLDQLATALQSRDIRKTRWDLADHVTLHPTLARALNNRIRKK